MMPQHEIDEVMRELSTLQDMVRWTVSRFNAAAIYLGQGSDNSWDEALDLILSTLSLPRQIPQEIYAARLLPSEKKTIIQYVQQRIDDRIPVPYLTQQAWFCDLPFYVDERVLIPRSPIGELITAKFQPFLPQPPKQILDLCTGSGCIAIACAYAFPDAEVDAVDLSLEALAVAEHNIAMHHLTHRVIPINSDLFSAIPNIKYDLIVTNPPYVDAEDMNDLPEEFHHEPELALAAGEDGLMLVREILANAADHLNDNGLLICEVGNSSVHLTAAYPDVPFHWFTFTQGGEGVFMLTRQQLITYRSHFLSK